MLDSIEKHSSKSCRYENRLSKKIEPNQSKNLSKVLLSTKTFGYLESVKVAEVKHEIIEHFPKVN